MIGNAWQVYAASEYALGPRHVFVADIGAGAWLVLDDDLLAPRLREIFAQHDQMLAPHPWARLTASVRRGGFFKITGVTCDCNQRNAPGAPWECVAIAT